MILKDCLNECTRKLVKAAWVLVGCAERLWPWDGWMQGWSYTSCPFPNLQFVLIKKKKPTKIPASFYIYVEN